MQAVSPGSGLGAAAGEGAKAGAGPGAMDGEGPAASTCSSSSQVSNQAVARVPTLVVSPLRGKGRTARRQGSKASKVEDWPALCPPRLLGSAGCRMPSYHEGRLASGDCGAALGRQSEDAAAHEHMSSLMIQLPIGLSFYVVNRPALDAPELISDLPHAGLIQLQGRIGRCGAVRSMLCSVKLVSKYVFWFPWLLGTCLRRQSSCLLALKCCRSNGAHLCKLLQAAHFAARDGWVLVAQLHSVEQALQRWALLQVKAGERRVHQARLDADHFCAAGRKGKQSARYSCPCPPARSLCPLMNQHKWRHSMAQRRQQQGPSQQQP